jgi:hypothetical protein
LASRMLRLDSRPRRGERILAQRGADALILLNPDDGQYFTLDEVGGRAWELCDGGRTVAEVATILHGEFDAPLDVIRTDVLELLNDLGRERLVVVERP